LLIKEGFTSKNIKGVRSADFNEVTATCME